MSVTKPADTGRAVSLNSLSEDGEKSETSYPNKKRALLVLGMHRSGTSALTRVLNFAGADLPTNLMPPIENNNEKGFWESNDLYRIHEELFECLNTSWDDLTADNLSRLDSDIADSFRKRIIDVLKNDFSGSRLFVIKDPRICRFARYWISILEEFGAEPLFIIIIRSPLEVCDSLLSRDGFSEAKTLLLWLRHFLEAEYHTRDQKRTFVSFDMLLEDWCGVLQKIGEELDIRWPPLSHYTTVEVEDFLEKKLRHHASDPDEIEARPDIVSWIKRCYTWGMEACNKSNSPTETLDEIRLSLETADVVFGPILAAQELELKKYRDETVLINEEETRQKAGLETQQNAMNENMEQIHRLEEELKASLERLKESDEETSFYRRRTGELTNELHDRFDEIMKLVEIIKDINEQNKYNEEQLHLLRRNLNKLGGGGIEGTG